MEALKMRNISFLTSKLDKNGNKHWSVAKFDNMTRSVTYFSDFMFYSDQIHPW